MNTIGEKEILTQKHVIQFFREELGYEYLGRWQDRDGCCFDLLHDSDFLPDAEEHVKLLVSIVKTSREKT